MGQDAVAALLDGAHKRLAPVVGALGIIHATRRGLSKGLVQFMVKELRAVADQLERGLLR